MEQVLLNLYVNAWQAMPDGGDLYVQTQNIVLDEDYLRPYQLDSGNYVKISITDTGGGMDDETRKRVFEPFFTTKDKGMGTGLGLASAYGIVKNHNGIINVYSEKGEGSTFNIYLPASQKEIKAEKRISDDIVRGSGTVLMVDDEKMVIDVGSEILMNLGYKVLTAACGREAISIYKNKMDSIDIVVLDMIMPDMSGRETYEAMKALNKDIKVLLSSGYSINGQAEKLIKLGCNGFIQKPFNVKQLSLKIKEILTSKKEAFEKD